MTSLMRCRGDRAALQACQAAWYSADSPDLQAPLPCQVHGDGSHDNEQYSYLDQQCSSGYSGRLCSSCEPGYGSSGDLHILSSALWCCVEQLSDTGSAALFVLCWFAVVGQDQDRSQLLGAL